MYIPCTHQFMCACACMYMYRGSVPVYIYVYIHIHACGVHVYVCICIVGWFLCVQARFVHSLPTPSCIAHKNTRK